MKITVQNWQKRNPRGDYKSMPWLRLQSDTYRSRKLHGLTPEQRWFWISLLCMVADTEEPDGTIECDLSYLVKHSECSEAAILATLEHCEKKELIKITYARRTADVRETDAARTLRNGTERNETERDGTEHVAPADADAPEELVLTGEIIEPEAKRAAKKRTKAPEDLTPGSRVWEAYLAAHKVEYPKASPARSSKTASLCKQLVERLGEENATAVVRFYLTHRKRYYIEQCHAIAACVQDAEALLVQMQQGQRVTAAAANAVDKDAANSDVFERAFAKLATQQVKTA